jgi:hypothetical protein
MAGIEGFSAFVFNAEDAKNAERGGGWVKGQTAKPLPLYPSPQSRSGLGERPLPSRATGCWQPVIIRAVRLCRIPNPNSRIPPLPWSPFLQPAAWSLKSFQLTDIPHGGTLPSMLLIKVQQWVKAMTLSVGYRKGG